MLKSITKRQSIRMGEAKKYKANIFSQQYIEKLKTFQDIKRWSKTAIKIRGK